MLLAHRKAHARIWMFLAIALPVVLIVAAVVAPRPHEKDAAPLAKSGGAARK